MLFERKSIAENQNYEWKFAQDLTVVEHMLFIKLLARVHQQIGLYSFVEL